MFGDEIERLMSLHPVTGEILTEDQEIYVFPATHYVAGPERMDRAIAGIETELELRLAEFEGQGKLLEAQRPVVGRRRQPEPVLNQVHLSRSVALVHAPQLRHRVVRLVDEGEEVRREEVEKGMGRLAGFPPVEDSRVVLDA